MPDSTDEISDNPWHDDVLDRGGLAATLEAHLVQRTKASKRATMSIALDGRWGSGKTFFVERWIAQLQSNGRCVIFFDAWQHDRAIDPALAFMAELSRQVKEWAARTIDTDATMSTIETTLNETLSHIKRAAKPVATTFLSGLMKKTIGSSISDLLSAASGEDDSKGDSSQTSATQALDQALDQYLDQVMAEHEIRHSSVAKFRQSLEALANSLAKAKSLEGPVFVVIDELDRCRPNFAVQLLEGVKHLFSVRNVCFVFSTNLPQLAASVQAVYGPNFDGRDYLGRFFEQELKLPLPTGQQFARFLFRETNENRSSRIFSGSYFFEDFSGEHRDANIWTGLCRSLGVTLRQQQQAFTTFDISCNSYPGNGAIPGVWLMFLCLLQRAYPTVFSNLHHARRGPSTFDDFFGILKAVPWHEQLLRRGGRSMGVPTDSIELSRLLFYHFALSKMDYPGDVQAVSSNTEDVARDLAEFVSGGCRPGDPSMLSTPFRIVSTAGLLS
ncbi:P-loop NTPase fold protein [Achromobacter sp. MFA1 R4]|uniref:KAP family P-loop NTPase fold protein n=1 Tax=Achromobacter sp. MFA1 R4 TaxID=1881016 RepID=UPI0009711F40|nr:P-loop NTPase fold protein [Achromobacter sp. MFA1 R4]